MASNDNSVAQITQLAKAHTFIGAASWKYVHEGSVLVNGSDQIAAFGQILYANPNYELGQVLKMGDWHFTLERKSVQGRLAHPDKNAPTVYVLTAFHKEEHYNFGVVVRDSPDTMSTFTNLVFSTMGPILVPEVAGPLMDETKPVSIEWKRDLSPECLMERFGKVYISVPLP